MLPRYRMRITALIVALLLATSAHAQTNVINFTADITQADGVATPTLTWSTTPAATSCTASGDWSGSKPATGGSEKQPSSMVSRTFNLTCTWGTGAAGSALLKWTAPTQNTDGSALTDLTGFAAYWGPTATSFPNTQKIAGAATTQFTVSSLAPGTWFFAVTAVNARGVESVVSNTATKTIAGSTQVSRSVGVVVNPVPQPPVLTVQ